MIGHPLTERFEQGLQYAIQLHAGQKRKGTEIPYIAHLLAVTAIVLENGGDEDQAIAALLHDGVEDQGGLPTLEQIRFRFGDRVARIVDGCTDAYTNPKPPWRERKEGYLSRLSEESGDILLVSLADKLHNARSLLYDLRRVGNRTWKRFNGGKEGTLWYYRRLGEIFHQKYPGSMVDEFLRVVAEIEQLTDLS